MLHAYLRREMIRELEFTRLCQNVLVEMRLEGAHLNTEDAFAFGRQLCEDVSLEATQHKRLELRVQLLDLLLVVDIVEVELVREMDCSSRQSK